MAKYLQSRENAELPRISTTDKEDELTLRQLRAYIASTKSVKHMPTAKALRGSEDLIVKRKVRDAVIEVYANGFAIYQKPCHQTVIRMDYVGKVTYEEYSSDGKTKETHTFDLEDEKWSVAVMMTGEKRMEMRYEEKQARTMISLTGTGFCDDEDSEQENMEIDAGIDVENIVLEADERRRMLAVLSEHQRDIVEKYYIEGMSQQEIADIFGIGQRTVSTLLKRSLKKIKKFF